MPLRTKMSPRLLAALVVAGLVPAMASCAPALVGAGASVGLAAMQERGVEGVARDTALSASVMSNFLNNDSSLTTDVGVEVWEGRALLTGLVKTEAERAEAVRLTWQVSGIKDVINEIGLESDEGIQDFTYDAWITTQLESRITFDRDIFAINYDIETVNSVVYLIGIAQSQGELDRVVAHARDIERVRRVISHVRVKDPVEAPEGSSDS